MAQRFLCRHCQHVFVPADAPPGGWVMCPHCSNRLRVPAAGEATSSSLNGRSLITWAVAAVLLLLLIVAATAVFLQRRDNKKPDDVFAFQGLDRFLDQKAPPNKDAAPEKKLPVKEPVPIPMPVPAQGSAPNTPEQPFLPIPPPDPVEPKKEPVPAKIEPVEPKEPPVKPNPNFIMALDIFGNPQGKEVGLARPAEFLGKKIIAWWNPKQQGKYILRKDNPLWASLRDKGFDVRVETGTFQVDWLKQCDQLWLFSGINIGDENTPPSGMNPFVYNAIVEFVSAGKGLYLLADDAPHCIDEANYLAKLLFGCQISGNDPGQKTAFIASRKLSPEQIQKYNGHYAARDHLLFTGVNFIYEGVSISTFSPSPKLNLVLQSSVKKPLIAVSGVRGQRVVLDCGFTKYYYDDVDPQMNYITRTAGTLQFANNVAAYLAGKDRP